MSAIAISLQYHGISKCCRVVKMQTMDGHYGAGAETGLILNFC